MNLFKRIKKEEALDLSSIKKPDPDTVVTHTFSHEGFMVVYGWYFTAIVCPCGAWGQGQSKTQEDSRRIAVHQINLYVCRNMGGGGGVGVVTVGGGGGMPRGGGGSNT